MKEILIATIGALAVIVPALVSSHRTRTVVTTDNAKTRRSVADLHDKLDTNHGLTPGQYLEMVSDVRDDVRHVGGRVDSTMEMLADHIVHNGARFADLGGRVRTLERATPITTEPPT